MPIALDTQETFEVVLKNDAAKPEASRPRFRFRYMTTAEVRAAARPITALELAGNLSSDGALDALLKAVEFNLVGWENISGRDGKPLLFGKDRLDSIVTVSELWELYYAAQRGQRLSVPEKNASASPSATAGESSAPPAGRDAAKTR